MSQNPQALEKIEKLPFAALMFPFATIEAIGVRILSSFVNTSNPKPKAKDQISSPSSIPAITRNLHYVVADRAYNSEVLGHRVSFYHYYTDRMIRIVCRELRHLKPIEFTPEIAEKERLVFDIDGAIQWIRKNGLEAASANAMLPMPPTSPAKNIRAAAKSDVAVDSNKTAAVFSEKKNVQLNIVPATGNKGLPFTGHIVSFGIVKRTGMQDKKPYVTYAMKLQSESGAYEKEFIGEHLSDLVEQMDLVEGQLIRIQLLGKHHFEVEVDGQMEKRSRNHFAIKLL